VKSTKQEITTVVATKTSLLKPTLIKKALLNYALTLALIMFKAPPVKANDLAS
jgi:hypothetical protein